ncbi:bifunctional tRNA (adenosine(37)-N6)-threonylcarbamoyltransferase complex ATPase subunit type 1 TsaE/phosphotransferase [Undibacterium sp. YM2]|uniref:tRNA (adenosine(37)-N6)-threonylcarbamoyltransferase complex ATPase subunit type 1 TsaE n=1 Tax=Undibacterium sp. YM2 TaxID=2058625 RepID=UPI001331F236|nr:tRNA (adenosine(37)-N6)-threonylcarbamoyltransferase complex ATPase subunit type 1 TsaE [Undibacterium sp. YM2]BBB65375.1 bifunctional tRNA (adenosine(37)-N6)-threonylcarbamoyltransferase complex ATPase subunit type 1 TsaE/phosphotransferase [Undibacterium sp. YM2]
MSHYKTTLADEAATQALGKCLAHALTPGMSIFLHGDLGAGKTALTRAMIHAAGHSGNVKSPTYTLAEPYQVSIKGQAVTIMHFDLYRMISADEFAEAGFREEFNDSNICVVEWPEKADGVLPEPDLNVFLHVAGDGREVELHALSAKGIACLASLKFAPNL